LEKILKKHNSFHKNCLQKKALETSTSFKNNFPQNSWAGEHSFSCPDEKTLPKGRKDFNQTSTLIKKAKVFRRTCFSQKVPSDT